MPTTTSNGYIVHGAIEGKWLAFKGVNGPLRAPLGNETPTFDKVGRYQKFQGGIISWHPETGAHVVWGSIGTRWLQLGREKFGYPVTDESATPDTRGRYNHFRAVHVNGKPEMSIYWTPETGAHEVFGLIRQRWSALGWEKSPVGYPLTGEIPTFDKVGRYQDFQWGTFSWHPETGAHIVWGSIRAQWIQLGREHFGYPITDESITPDKVGRYNHFRAVHVNGKPEKSIYWTPNTRSHEVYGAIRDRWARSGWERSNLGYPTSGEQNRGDAPGREQQFEHGRIIWHPSTGALFDPLEFSIPIKSAGFAALGGSATLSFYPDGLVRWKVHAHNSGADGYRFALSAIVRSPSGKSFAAACRGRVGGTFTSGSRNYDWNYEERNNSILYHLADFHDGQLEYHLDYSSDFGSTLEGAFGWLIKASIGKLVAPGSLVMFLGAELGSLVATGSLVPGARIIAGTLWMAGPDNTLYAIVAEGIASLGSRTRRLTPEEYNWANNEVFKGALPPLDSIVLTDTIGGGERPFVFPRFDGKFTLNIGSAGFADPRLYPEGVYGETFIHELVHTCQLYSARGSLGYLADAFAAKVCEVTGSNPYTYGPAGRPFSEFNFEQQGQIVQDWFAGKKPANTNHTGIPKDENSPYYSYIVNNVRTGIF